MLVDGNPVVRRNYTRIIYSCKDSNRYLDGKGLFLVKKLREIPKGRFPKILCSLRGKCWPSYLLAPNPRRYCNVTSWNHLEDLQCSCVLKSKIAMRAFLDSISRDCEEGRTRNHIIDDFYTQNWLMVAAYPWLPCYTVQDII